MSEIHNAIAATQEIVEEISPAPPTFERLTPARDLKARLDWGEPALTIIDVRDRDRFNTRRIMGAIHHPVEQLVERALKTLEPTRDIYLYADTEDDAMNAANQLAVAGYEQVALLQGGLEGWLAVNGPVEGYDA